LRTFAHNVAVIALACFKTKIIYSVWQQCMLDSHNYTHTHLTAFFSGTTQLSRYQKGKTNPDFTEASDSEWQWHQLGHMQVCASLQTDNYASTPLLCFLQARYPPFLPPNQQCQSTEGTTSLLL